MCSGRSGSISQASSSSLSGSPPHSEDEDSDTDISRISETPINIHPPYQSQISSHPPQKPLTPQFTHPQNLLSKSSHSIHKLSSLHQFMAPPALTPNNPNLPQQPLFRYSAPSSVRATPEKILPHPSQPNRIILYISINLVETLQKHFKQKFNMSEILQQIL
ncbi:hypothetical protein O181_095799 [Austropuccinia psidii MF-1]|uniref:Uncharacterized protein n=1 Tax=Austropuccinia psidii MF-1 TaxID=1389203 RepID=A0A9Q3PC40_9BASI|nr:hypothetical protein [Austropuccinia psidii MF-1]